MFFWEIYATSESLGSVCSLWSPQGISDRDEGLGPGFDLLFLHLFLIPEGSHVGVFKKLLFLMGFEWWVRDV